MGFVTMLPRIPLGHKVVLMIVDRLTKSVHFILLRVRCSLEKMTNIYIWETVRLHGVVVDIVLDRDIRFLSCFLAKFA